MRLNKNDLMIRSFQYSQSDSLNKNQWLSVDVFKAIYKWKMQGIPPQIKWDCKLNSDLIFSIVCACPDQELFIGIKGGKNALESMTPEMIQNKSWNIISSASAPNSQWIGGDIYRRILTYKGLWQTGYPNDRPGVLVAKSIINRIIKRYSNSYDFFIYDTHPCSEQYDCISMGIRHVKTILHLLDFNINGRLHIHRDIVNTDLSVKVEPFEFIDVSLETCENIFDSICKDVFVKGIEKTFNEVTSTPRRDDSST